MKAGLTHFEIQKILLQFNALSMFGLYLREEIVRMFEQLLCEVCPRVSNFFRPIFYLSSSSSYFFQSLLNFPIRFSNNGVPINLISSKWSILRIHRKKIHQNRMLLLGVKQIKTKVFYKSIAKI